MVDQSSEENQLKSGKVRVSTINPADLTVSAQNQYKNLKLSAILRELTLFRSDRHVLDISFFFNRV